MSLGRENCEWPCDTVWSGVLKLWVFLEPTERLWMWVFRDWKSTEVIITHWQECDTTLTTVTTWNCPCIESGWTSLVTPQCFLFGCVSNFTFKQMSVSSMKCRRPGLGSSFPMSSFLAWPAEFWERRRCKIAVSNTDGCLFWDVGACSKQTGRRERVPG